MKSYYEILDKQVLGSKIYCILLSNENAPYNINCKSKLNLYCLTY
jgi:hypothetical protein